MNIRKFKEIGSHIAKTTKVELEIRHTSEEFIDDYRMLYLADLEPVLATKTGTNSIIVNELMLDLFECYEHAYFGICHEVGHIVLHNIYDIKPLKQREIEADLYARKVCLELGLCMLKCAGLFTLLGEGDKEAYPSMATRIHLATTGAYRKI